MKKLVFTLLLVSMLMMAVAGAVSADPVGACPAGDSWSLVELGATIDGIDVGNFHDQNGDGYVCVRVNQGQTKKNGGFPSWVVKDNTNPLP